MTARAPAGEEGAGAALAVGLVAAVIAAFLLLAMVATVLDAHRRVVGIADAAALAGADTALGAATGLPCERASALVTDGAVRLDSCEQRGTLVRVRVSVSVLGVAVRAVAVAGPPPVAP